MKFLYIILLFLLICYSVHANLYTKSSFGNIKDLFESKIANNLIVDSTKFGIDISSGFLINRIYYANEIFPKEQRINNLIFIPINISFLANLKRLNIGIGEKSLFDTKLIKDEKSYVFFHSFHALYFMSEYTIIKQEKYTIAPNIKIGIFNSNSSKWYSNSEIKSKVYYEFCIISQININRLSILIYSSISYFELTSEFPNTPGYNFIIYGLNIGIRHWF